MTYIVIPADGSQPDVRDGSPSLDELILLVGDGTTPGLPEKVRTDHGHEAVLWVNEDFVAQGLQRNVLGTVLAAILGAPRQPYAGPVIVTSLELDPMEGYGPGALEATMALTLEAALHDSAVIVGLHDCALSDDRMPEEYRAMIREVGEYARTASDPTSGLTVFSANSSEELLDILEAMQRGETPPGGIALG